MWLDVRRAQAKLGNLSGKQMQLIEDALGLDALVPVLDVTFERKLADVVEHRKRHGKFPAYGNLGNWLNDCRDGVNDGCLPEARAQRLDTVLGAEWRPAFKSDTV